MKVVNCFCESSGPRPNPKETIELSNESDREVLVYVVADPDALRLKEKTVTSEGSAHAEAGAYGVGVGLGANKGSEIKYEAVGNGIGVQKVRIKPGNQSPVYVEGTSYIAVIFYANGLYHFAIESRRVKKQTRFVIHKLHLESEIPFKTSTAEPNYGSMMEQ